MMRCLAVLVALVLAVWATTAAHANALFGSAGLNPDFCKQPTYRQTAIYIDDMMMVDGSTEWARKIATKLKATLAPGERVTVVRLSPQTGQSNEIWSGCWPNFTAAERDRLSHEHYIISENPLNTVAEQQKYFFHDLDGALVKIYDGGKRSASAVKIDGTHPADKEIIRSLASDEGRFSQSQTTIRAIVYSDLAENSDLGSVFKPTDPVDYGDKLGTYLRHSVFYVFGVAEDVTNAPDTLEQSRRFWGNVFATMNAAVGGIGADLNLPNALPVTARTYTLDMARDGVDLDGRISLLADSDGTLVDSWIGVSRLSIAGLTGTFLCAGRDDGATCRLNATTTRGIATKSPTESVSLSGTDQAGLVGELGVKGALMFPLKATKPN